MTRTFPALALLVVAVAAYAAPSLIGPSGLVLTPTTSVLAPNSWSAVVTTCPTGKETVAAVNFAPRPNVEVGVADINQSDLGTNRKCLNVKYQVQPETAHQIGVAVGAEVISHLGHPVWYADASTPLRGLMRDTVPVARAFLGVGEGGKENDPMLPIHGVFTGVEFADARYRALAEYDSTNVNASLRAVVKGPISAQVAWIGDRHLPVYAVTYQP